MEAYTPPHNDLTPEFCAQVQQKVEELKKDIKSKKHNVASIGFVFVNQHGRPINTKPFHFFPGARSDTPPSTLETPFFFLSGRKQRDYQQASDPAPWDALPQSAPSSAHLSLIPSPLPNNSQPKSLGDLFQDVPGPQEIEQLRSQLQEICDHYTHASENYINRLKEGWAHKAQQLPFFNSIRERHRREKDVFPRRFCPEFLRVLELSTLNLPNNNYYPQKPSDHNPNQEGDFTHSEQWALFQASLKPPGQPFSHFETFMDACAEALTST